MEETLSNIAQLIALSWAVIQGLLTIYIQAFTKPKPDENYGETYLRIKNRMKILGIVSITIAIIFLISMIVIIIVG